MTAWFSLSLTLKQPRHDDLRIPERWKNAFAKVEDHADIPYLAFLGELIHILDPGEEPFFATPVYTRCGMFSDREQRWTLGAGNIRITRAVHAEISESWQRVEEHENSRAITGLPEGTRIEWGGDFADLLDEFKIRIKGIDGEQADRIRAAAAVFFRQVETTIREVRRPAHPKPGIGPVAVQPADAGSTPEETKRTRRAAPVIALERMRRDVEIMQTRAGQVGDIIDKADLGGAAAEAAMAEMSGFDEARRRAGAALDDRLRELRRDFPEVIERWVGVHQAACRAYISEAPKVKVRDREMTPWLARDTIRQFDMVLAGERNFVSINNVYLRDYDAIWQEKLDLI